MVKSIMCVTILPALICSGFFGCEKSTDRNPAEQTVYTSLYDIPGITEDEIEAIKMLREQKASFTFGMCPSTEAFTMGAESRSENDSELGGFTPLFCDWLTELFDIPFEPKFYEWGDLIGGLEKGTIDFTDELTADDERRMTYIMTDAIAARSIKAFRMADSPTISEIAAKRTPRISFLANSTTIGKVKQHLDYDCKIFYEDDYDTIYNKLSNGEIDIYFDDGPAEAVFDAYGDVVAEDFFPLVYNPISLATQKPELDAVISVVQKALENGGIHYLNGLYNQGYNEYKRHRLFTRFSKEELAYLDTHTVVPFAAEFDIYPKSFYNANEKEWQGIVFDVLSEVEVLTGLRFKVVNDGPTEFSALLKMLEGGDALFISEIIRTKEREGHYLWPKEAYLHDQSALISKTDFPNINVNELISVKVGLHKNTAHSELFLDWFPEHKNIKYYDSTKDSLEALKRGEVDVVMESISTLLHLTNYQEMVGYKANFVFHNSIDSTFGFNKNEPVLCSIMDKTMESIDIKTISGQWTRKSFDYRAKLAEAQRPWVIGAMILLTLVMILIMILFYRKRKADRLAMETEIREQTLSTENSMLDTLNRMKSEFFQNMSHDLKTPLTVISTDILNAADYLDYEMDKEDMRNSLNHAQSEIMLMARMVDSVLKYTSMQENQENMVSMDMAAFLREGGENYRAMLEKNGNSLVLRIPEAPVRIRGNADTLLQVLSNLISNANNHTRNGEVNVHASIESGEVVVTVRDNGTGIKPELLPHIFERGVSDSGTGLGLPICKSAIESHNGRISVTSECRKGTIVIITLPLYGEDKADG